MAEMNMHHQRQNARYKAVFYQNRFIQNGVC